MEICVGLDIVIFNLCGSVCRLVTVPVFKTGGRHLSDVAGAFDSHTLPPFIK